MVNVGNDQLKELVANGAALIDVRRLEEWVDTGVVEGSEKMTFFDDKGNYDAKTWFEDLQLVATKDQPVVLICWTGVRSKVIANWLDNGMGYDKVYNVKKGIKHWIDQGQPTTKQ